MRRLIAFPCAGETLVGTLDPAAGATGLLIVSGGNEVRGGAHRGMASLARRFAESGTPVLRFDRRGVGDSTGANRGYASSAPDIAAAAAALRRAQPQIRRLVGFGNCDAASALALFGRDAGLDAVVLANPCVVEADTLPPAAAIRRRYADRLRDRATWRRLLRGDVDFTRLAKGLAKLLRPEPEGLADRITDAVASWGEQAEVILAEGDATAIAFAAADRARGSRAHVTTIATGSHSFARAGDAEALEVALLRRL